MSYDPRVLAPIPAQSLAPAQHPYNPLAAAPLPLYCNYCGGTLDPRYYFCVHCATPFQSPDAVVPVAMPKMLTGYEMIERKAPGVWPLFWTYFAVVLGGGLLALAIFGFHRPAYALLFGTVLLAITTCVLGAIYFRSLVSQFKRFGFFSPWAWAAMGALAPLLALNWVYHGWIEHVYRAAERLTEIKSYSELGFSQSAMILLLCVYPAIAEEIAFRGLLQHWLHAAVRPFHAMILASALFAAVHLSIISFPYLFLVGMLLGWAKWKTGSLYPSMVCHFLHNFVVLMFFHS